ncbi:MAG TPA: hypothetical protein DF712_19890 [Balneola sp.]|nr:hypothetical protein [Balneola sp.]|tara:strand:- start:651 stop:836 length:186 start_codon:yes stop_codon:yes gene_type:complete
MEEQNISLELTATEISDGDFEVVMRFSQIEDHQTAASLLDFLREQVGSIGFYLNDHAHGFH